MSEIYYMDGSRQNLSSNVMDQIPLPFVPGGTYSELYFRSTMEVDLIKDNVPYIYAFGLRNGIHTVCSAHAHHARNRCLIIYFINNLRSC